MFHGKGSKLFHMVMISRCKVSKVSEAASLVQLLYIAVQQMFCLYFGDLNQNQSAKPAGCVHGFHICIWTLQSPHLNDSISSKALRTYTLTSLWTHAERDTEGKHCLCKMSNSQAACQSSALIFKSQVKSSNSIQWKKVLSWWHNQSSWVFNELSSKYSKMWHSDHWVSMSDM